MILCLEGPHKYLHKIAQLNTQLEGNLNKSYVTFLCTSSHVLNLLEFMDLFSLQLAYINKAY